MNRKQTIVMWVGIAAFVLFTLNVRKRFSFPRLVYKAKEPPKSKFEDLIKNSTSPIDSYTEAYINSQLGIKSEPKPSFEELQDKKEEAKSLQLVWPKLLQLSWIESTTKLFAGWGVITVLTGGLIISLKDKKES